jgi:putative PIN family toxin of toxin-antitoxin system
VRWVLDTNIALSALAWRGAPYRLLQAIRGQPEAVQLFSSQLLLVELAGVLARPHLRKPLAAIGRTPADVLTDYAASVEIVAPTEIPRVITDDPDDDHVLACALAARADAIVSGDRHLLALQPQWRGIDVLTAVQAVERIEQPIRSGAG